MYHGANLLAGLPNTRLHTEKAGSVRLDIDRLSEERQRTNTNTLAPLESLIGDKGKECGCGSYAVITSCLSRACGNHESLWHVQMKGGWGSNNMHAA